MFLLFTQIKVNIDFEEISYIQNKRDKIRR